MNVLIIEDDIGFAESLCNFLKDRGICAECLLETSKIEEKIKNKTLDLIILDINLGKENGFQVYKKISNQTSVPIIFLTGRDGDKDEVYGLQLGAIDYIKKPFNKEVLLARIYRAKDSSHSRNFGSYILDIVKNTVYDSETNYCIELSNTEFQILYCLFNNPNKIVRREDVISFLWDNVNFIDENALNVNLSRLRKKLYSKFGMSFIETVKGEGLRLCQDK